MKRSTGIQHIAVFSSGGDAPGMNAAIRAVVRTAIFRGLRVTGIMRGYQGMIDDEFMPMELSSVANILQRGGTILKTGRSQQFRTKAGRKEAAQNIQNHQIDGIIAIGGDGTFTGAHALWVEHKIPIIGIPGTIDNDVYGTDFTVGFDTAVNTALDAIDKIRDTAASHDRLFIVEVMGRNSGYIASNVGVAGGAEAVVSPENPLTVKQIIAAVERGLRRGKSSSIIVLAEDHKPGKAYKVAAQIRKIAGFDAKVAILGHIQRGGTPTAQDRILASRLGAAAVDMLVDGKSDCMVGQINNEIVGTPLKEAFSRTKKLESDLLNLQTILAT